MSEKYKPQANQEHLKTPAQSEHIPSKNRTLFKKVAAVALTALILQIPSDRNITSDNRTLDTDSPKYNIDYLEENYDPNLGNCLDVDNEFLGSNQLFYTYQPTESELAEFNQLPEYHTTINQDIVLVHHQVSSGETLSGIADKFSKTLSVSDQNLYHQIIEQNNITNPDQLRVNQIIDIPLSDLEFNFLKTNHPASLSGAEKFSFKKSNNQINFYSANSGSFKSYMDYRAITSKASDQFRLQQIAETSDYGIRAVEYQGQKRPLIALGTGLIDDLRVGSVVELIIKNPDRDFTKIIAIVGDIKDNKDTDSNNIAQKYDKSIMELINDKNHTPEIILKTGDYSSIPELNGQICQIKKIDQIDF